MNTVIHAVLRFAPGTSFVLQADLRKVALTKMSSDVLSSHLDKMLNVDNNALSLGIVGVG